MLLASLKLTTLWVEAGLELLTFLPLPPKSWDWRSVVPCPLGKDFINEITSFNSISATKHFDCYFNWREFEARQSFMLPVCLVLFLGLYRHLTIRFLPLLDYLNTESVPPQHAEGSACVIQPCNHGQDGTNSPGQTGGRCPPPVPFLLLWHREGSPCKWFHFLVSAGQDQEPCTYISHHRLLQADLQ